MQTMQCYADRQMVDYAHMLGQDDDRADAVDSLTDQLLKGECDPFDPSNFEEAICEFPATVMRKLLVEHGGTALEVEATYINGYRHQRLGALGIGLAKAVTAYWRAKAYALAQERVDEPEVV